MPGPVLSVAAIVDLGSASASMMVVSPGKRGRIDVLARAKAPLRLAGALDADDRLSDVAFDQTVEAMRSFAALAQSHGAERIRAVATEALRRATNGPALCAAVREASGIELEVIDGEREARLVFAGMRLEVRRGGLLGLDIGGGSTELVWGVGPTPERMISLPFGAIETTRRLGLGAAALSPAELAEARHRLDGWILPQVRAFAPDIDLSGLASAGRAVGTSGSVQRIARLIAAGRGQIRRSLAHVPIDAQALAATVETLACRNHQQRAALPGMDLERADSLLAGALVLERVGLGLGVGSWRVGLSGLRLGLGAVALGIAPDWRPIGVQLPGRAANS